MQDTTDDPSHQRYEQKKQQVFARIAQRYEQKLQNKELDSNSNGGDANDESYSSQNEGAMLEKFWTDLNQLISRM